MKLFQNLMQVGRHFQQKPGAATCAPTPLAAGLLNVLKSARFCICLIIFHDVLRTIHVVYKSLQARDITLFSAKTCVENMIHVFKTMRTGAKWDEMREKIKEFSESSGIVVCESKFMLFKL